MASVAAGSIRAARTELAWLAEVARAPRLRSLGEFAQEEIVIPRGKYAGRKLRTHRQPFTRLLFEASAGPWPRRAVLGCVQSGKSLTGFVAPIMYHLFELRETVICGVPTIDISGDKYRDEILPVIQRSRYRDLVPTKGLGSRGGSRVESITFRNGATLKFMSGGGGDEKRSSFTARAVVITEVDKMDEAAASSREADPISQLEARTLSYDDHERRLYLECTVSIEHGRIWQEYTNGTASQIVCPCPICGAWVSPEREHLVGWQEAENKIEARRLSHFVCPACGEKLDDTQRRDMNLQSKLVHRGQEIAPDGEIHGEPAETDTMGFRWNAWNNLFWSPGSIGAAEWAGARAQDEENAKKELLQFYWAQPYEDPAMEDVPLDHTTVLSRRGGFPQGVLPADTVHFTVAVDCGKWQSWYLCLAFRANGTIHVPDYGVIEVHSDNAPGGRATDQHVARALTQALREFRDVVETGWILDGGERRKPDRVWVDCGWLPDAVFAFARESGQLWLPAKGTGRSQMARREYRGPSKKSKEIREVGDGWHVSRVQVQRWWRADFDADRYKLEFQSGFAAQPGGVGSISLFSGVANRHNKLARHVTSEHFKREFVPGKGEVEWWEKHGANHWLDCGAMALAAGRREGFRLDTPSRVEPAQAAAGEPTSWFAEQQRRARR